MGLVSNVQIRGSSYYINGTNTYTALGVPLQESWTKNGYIVNTKYAYKNGAGGDNARSTQIASVRFSKGEEADDQGYSYNYDDVGNITRVGILNDSDGFTRSVDYHYDKNNQLIRVDDKPNNQTVQYVYDVQGNLTQRTYHPYTTAATVTSTATKTDTWTYGGRDNNVIRASTIDGVTNEYHYTYYGMPNNWTGGRAITWRNGTEIASIGDVTFTYDSEGQRKTKTVGNNTTRYYYEGDRLIKMDQGDISLFFLYDQNGLFGFDKINTDGTKSTYYYRIDARGEIVALLNGYGNVVANYNYDPWGNILSVTSESGGSLSSTHIGKLNPFRYKSYVYDNETELYYLNSRYYDPQVCRFVSRDEFEYLGVGSDASLNSYNLFAYCYNNPVSNMDESGHIVANIVTGIIVGGVMGAVEAMISGESIKTGFFCGAISGGLMGVISFVAIPKLAYAAGSVACGVVAAAANIATQTNNIANSYGSEFSREVWNKEFDLNETITTGVLTMALTPIGFGMSGIEKMFFYPAICSNNEVLNLIAGGVTEMYSSIVQLAASIIFPEV